MGRSIELNPSLGPSVVPGHIMQELFAHARDSAPEECCGLITGMGGEPFQVVHRITNAMNKMHLQDPSTYPRDNQEAFYMAESEVLAVIRAAEASETVVTTVYHSHVGSGIYLSGDDLEYAEHPLSPFPGAAQLVVSVLGETVEGAGIFLYDTEGGRFDRNGGRSIEVSGG